MDNTRRSVAIEPTDIAPYRDGNAGLPFVHSFSAAAPGPHVVINALMHGNELCGAAALDHLFRRGIRPRRGRLTLSFANVAAYGRFDPAQPTVSRYVDEDMNRVWGDEMLQSHRRSLELDRARALLPVFESADLLLDLHSMQNHAEALTLCGAAARGADLALRIGLPRWVVADTGHAAGRRLIDRDRFVVAGGGATAILAECGQHWQPDTVRMAVALTRRFLLSTGCVDAADLGADPELPPDSTPMLPPRRVVVTRTVTAATDSFTFLGDFVGMEVIPKAGTVLAQDGPDLVRTPYDDCVLVMPSRGLRAGQTAVRLGRLVD